MSAVEWEDAHMPVESVFSVVFFAVC